MHYVFVETPWAAGVARRRDPFPPELRVTGFRNLEGRRRGDFRGEGSISGRRRHGMNRISLYAQKKIPFSGDIARDAPESAEAFGGPKL